VLAGTRRREREESSREEIEGQNREVEAEGALRWGVDIKRKPNDPQLSQYLWLDRASDARTEFRRRIVVL
jgi:hypothetical protein